MTTDKKVIKIGTIAKQGGITPNLLRAWEKRYGLFDPQRGQGGQRLYCKEDILLLQYISEKINSGHRIGEMAKLGRQHLLDEIRVKQDAKSSTAVNRQDDDFSHRLLKRYIEPLISGARQVNANKLRNGLTAAQLELSLDSVVFQVILPAMQELGDQYLKGKISIAGEHLISSMIEQFLRNAIDEASMLYTGMAENPEICCCFPGEEHRLGLMGVAYSLARNGRHVILLGACMPFDDLGRVIEQVAPLNVWLSVTSPCYFSQHIKELVDLVQRSHTQFVVGGQGISPEDRDLDDAGCKFIPPHCNLPEDIYNHLQESN